MGALEIVLLIAIILAFAGGGFGAPAWRAPGIGLGGLLVVVLIVVLVAG